MSMSPQDLTALNAQIQAALQADPALLILAKQAGLAQKGATPLTDRFVHALRAKGIVVPATGFLDRGLSWNAGKLQFEPDDSFLAGRSGVLAGVAALTGGLAYGALAGAGAETGGSAIADAAAGAGTTGSTVPVIGSLAPEAASVTPAAALSSGVGTVAGVGSALKKIGPLLGDVGQSVGAATDAAGANRLTQENQDTIANGQNISGQANYENELLARAKTESEQRNQALKDAYRASYATNRTPGPFNTTGLTKYSPEYLASLTALQRQALAKLEQDPTYDTTKMDPLKPYVPYVPSASANAKPSTLERVGNIISPTLGIVGAVGRYWK